MSGGVEAPHPANAVLIGKKDVNNYVLAIIRLFSEGAEEVIVKARGKNICKAVDAVERVRRMYMKDLIVKDVKIGSEEVEDEGGRKRLVSAMEIVLARAPSEGEG
ncbi:DNA-binding protein Alba [Stetteria hydrogenophila]